MRIRLRTVALAAVILLLNPGSRASAAAIYWADFDGNTIRTANLDGTGKRTLVTGQNLPVGPTLDLPGGKMYWGNTGGGDIRRANLDGSGQTTLLRGLAGPGAPALDLAGGLMYWNA